MDVNQVDFEHEQLLIESSIDAMIAIDLDNKVLAWNKAAVLMFGKEKEFAIGKPLQDALASVDEDIAILTAISQAKSGRKSFLPADRDILYRKHVEIHIIPLQNKQGVIGAMLLVHDVSHRIKKEEELQKLNSELQMRLRQLKLHSAEFAHLTHIASKNIREPIRLLYTNIEWLIQSEARGMSNAGRASFRRMQSSLNRMNLLLMDIITITQINIADSPTQMVHVGEVLREVIVALDQRITDMDAEIMLGELCEIRAHRNQLVFMLQHLLSHALKSTENRKPYITIHCKKTTLESHQPSMSESKDYFVLAFTYNGDGLVKATDGSMLELKRDSKDTSYESSATVALIIAKVMEAHFGFHEIDNRGKQETVLRCYFPV